MDFRNFSYLFFVSGFLFFGDVQGSISILEESRTFFVSNGLKERKPVVNISPYKLQENTRTQDLSPEIAYDVLTFCFQPCDPLVSFKPWETVSPYMKALLNFPSISIALNRYKDIFDGCGDKMESNTLNSNLKVIEQKVETFQRWYKMLQEAPLLIGSEYYFLACIQLQEIFFQRYHKNLSHFEKVENFFPLTEFVSVMTPEEREWRKAYIRFQDYFLNFEAEDCFLDDTDEYDQDVQRISLFLHQAYCAIDQREKEGYFYQALERYQRIIKKLIFEEDFYAMFKQEAPSKAKKDRLLVRFDPVFAPIYQNNIN